MDCGAEKQMRRLQVRSCWRRTKKNDGRNEVVRRTDSAAVRLLLMLLLETHRNMMIRQLIAALPHTDSRVYNTFVGILLLELFCTVLTSAANGQRDPRISNNGGSLENLGVDASLSGIGLLNGVQSEESHTAHKTMIIFSLMADVCCCWC